MAVYGPSGRSWPTVYIAGNSYDPVKLRTQKSKGIAALQTMSSGVRWQALTMPPVCAVFPGAAVAPLKSLLGGFWRPCPPRPTHGGFIDSRKVETPAEAFELLRATLAADPGAEVLVMPEFTARWSAVVTPASVTIGEGNAGVTAGKGRCVTLPIPSDWSGLGRLLKKAEIGPNEAPYLEVVEDNWRAVAVQLRAGPATSAGDVFFAGPGKPVAILTAPLSSHEAVRAIAAGHSVIAGALGAAVLAGKVGKATALKRQGERTPLDHAVVLTAAREFLLAPLPLAWGLERAAGITGFCAGMLHAAPYLQAEHSVVTGRALALTVRAVAAACFGEVRHWLTLSHEGDGKYGRSAIITSALSNTAPWREHLPHAAECFGRALWPQHSVGGPTWRLATLACAKVWRMIDEGADWPALLAGWNYLVEAAHNGGLPGGVLAKLGQGALGTQVIGAMSLGEAAAVLCGICEPQRHSHAFAEPSGAVKDYSNLGLPSDPLPPQFHNREERWARAQAQLALLPSDEPQFTGAPEESAFVARHIGGWLVRLGSEEASRTVTLEGFRTAQAAAVAELPQSGFAEGDGDSDGDSEEPEADPEEDTESASEEPNGQAEAA